MNNIDPQHPMAPISALVRMLHGGRTLEERVRRARGKREGMRAWRVRRQEAEVAKAREETI